MRKGFVCLARVFFALAFVVAISTQVARAQATIHVPADQPTIQAAINAAQPGDTVLVAPGTYFENLNFNGKAITVTSSSGPSVTIVDGGGLGPVATFDTNEAANAVLNGFTLQHGVPSQAFPVFGESGGGILISDASPTITGNVITGNHAICGVGIEIQNGSPLIRDNTITNNTQAGGTGGCGGGGIEVSGHASSPTAAPLIIGNTITNNSLNGGGSGGGISVFGTSPIIRNNYIAGNSVWNTGGGINLENGGAPVVVDNIVINNTTLGGGSGAGIYVQGPSSSAAVVINNTIVGNNAFDGSSGIYSETPAPVVISNNIVVAASGQNGIVCEPSDSTFPRFSHNDVTLTGTGGQAWSSNCASFASTDGNISVDPQFANAAANDFHLLAGSPVIDAGNNTVPDLPQQDYDGNARVAIGNATTGSDTVDMGVYEFVLTGTPAATLSPTSLNFADQAVNTTSAVRTITLSNTGADPLTISGISVSGDFTQSNSCPPTLTTGSSCAILVTFVPTVLGARNGTLTVSSSSVPAAPTVPLSGTGVQPGTPVTINVPDNQPTIQAAVDAANSGDTVLVAPGTYFENLNFKGKAITVTSSGGPSVTIVDGGGLGPVVTFNTNEGANSVLSGFTLQNGVPAQFYPISGVSGGGILIMDASPVITGNVITGNHAINGVGMEIQGGSAVIRGNTITENTQAFGDGGRGGAGIEVNPGSTSSVAPQIIGNTITNNSLNGGGSGGGIGVFGTSPIIRNNYIAGNSVWNDGGGIDLEQGGAPVVADNIIFNNTTLGGGSGAGIYLQGVSSSTAVVINNTIVGNNAFDGSSGIYSDSLGFLISNNIVVAASGQNGIVCSPFSSTFPTFSHNDVTLTGTGGQAWSSNCASFASNNGNISLDPQFVNAANDFHVLAGSPVVDAGDNTVPDLPQLDYDGNPRVAIGNATTCSDIVDIGAYEFVLNTTPAAALTPSALDFGSVSVGSSSAPQTVTFTASQGCVAEPAITVSGDYREADNCSSTLGAGQSCSIQVTFSPATSGPSTGSLAVTFGNINLSTSLTGQGAVAVATLSPSSLNFGNQLVNTSSAAQTVTLSNTGTDPLSISGISVSGDFTESNTCPATLAVGSSCVIQVTFTPTATGARSGNLGISSNSVPAAPAIALTGTGVQPAMSVSPTSISFGDQTLNTTGPYQTITVTNTGTSTLHVNSLLVAGDPDLYVVTSTCVDPGTAPGVTCSIQVGFTPRSAGAASATLTITSDAANSPVSVPLSGTGVNPAMVSVSPAAITFGNQAVGSQSAAQIVTISNTGTVSLHITALTIGGDPDFATLNNSCPLTAGIPPGTSCSVQVVFAPRSLGPGSATLTITSDAANNPVSVSLSGTGVNPPKASVSPSALNFGSLIVGTQSTGQTVTITNTGGATLHINSLTVTNDPDFFVQTSDCVSGAGVAPGGSCSVQMAFAPKSAGAGSGMLTITSDDPAAPQVNVSLSGTGVDYALSASPASISARSGHTAQTTITVSALDGNFGNSVALSCNNLPTGASCSFSPTSVIPGASSASSRLTINTQQSGGIKTPLGTYSITVLGTSNGLTRSTVVALTVTN